jgi:hypothetical protein
MSSRGMVRSFSRSDAEARGHGRRQVYSMTTSIERLHDLPVDLLGALVVESERSGYGLVCRLVDDWVTGVNRFDRPGEALFAAWRDGELVGVCARHLRYSTSAHGEPVGRAPLRGTRPPPIRGGGRKRHACQGAWSCARNRTRGLAVFASRAGAAGAGQPGTTYPHVVRKAEGANDALTQSS